MGSALLTIHLIIALALIAVVLLQKSEGGALGMGGGGGSGGGFLTGRGQANLLTRVTAGLAAAFFCTSIALKLYSDHVRTAGSLFERTPAGAAAPSGGRGGSDLQPIIPLKPATPDPAAAPGAAPGAAPSAGGSSSAPAAPAPVNVPQSR